MYLGPGVVRIVYIAACDPDVIANVWDRDLVRISLTGSDGLFVSDGMCADNFDNKIAILFRFVFISVIIASYQELIIKIKINKHHDILKY